MEITCKKFCFSGKDNSMRPGVGLDICYDGGNYRANYEFDRYEKRYTVTVYSTYGNTSDMGAEKVLEYAKGILDSVREEVVRAFAKELESFKVQCINLDKKDY